MEKSFEAYEQVVSRFGYSPVIEPGRIDLLGWDLEYACGPALANFIDQILVRRLNDFCADNDRPFIIDCGANIGFSVLNYKRQYPAAKIIAIEPDPQFVPLLRRNLARNHAEDVEVVEAAAWIREGEANWLCEGIDGSKLILSDQRGPETAVVRTIDLADRLTGTVDLLKLDIEGAEFEVLHHVSGRLDSVQNLVVECHLDQSNFADFGRMLEELVAAGFSLGVNSFGPWKDLIRQEPVAPNHFEQYLLVAAWRTPIPRAFAELPLLPYAGAQSFLETKNLRTQTRGLQSEVHAARGERDAALDKALRACEGENRFLHLFRFILVGGRDSLQIRQLQPPFRPDEGFSWTLALPDMEFIADNDQNPKQSALLLFENDHLFSLPHSPHADIRAQGSGRYSHWKTNLFFSSSDGTDPNTNGRSYVAVFVWQPFTHKEDYADPAPYAANERLVELGQSLRRREADLDRHQAVLRQSEEQLNERAASLTEQQMHLDRKETKLAGWEAELAGWEAELAGRESAQAENVRRYNALPLVRARAFIRRHFGI